LLRRTTKRLCWLLGLGALLPLVAQGNPGVPAVPGGAKPQAQAILAPQPVPAESSAAKQAQPTGILGSLLDKAEDCLGIPYRRGGASPKGFDCSGFVRFVFGSVGINLDHSSAAQAKQGEPIALAQIQPGDLLFFNTRGVRKGISHVGIYLGQGQFIHASSLRGPGTHCVKIANLAQDYFSKRLVAVRRVVDGAVEMPKDILAKVFKEQDQDPTGTQDPNALGSAPTGAPRQP